MRARLLFALRHDSLKNPPRCRTHARRIGRRKRRQHPVARIEECYDEDNDNPTARPPLSAWRNECGAPILPYSRVFHLEVNVMARRKEPPSANARWSLGNLEGCQCQGPVGPRATTKPVHSHVGHRSQYVLKQY